MIVEVKVPSYRCREIKQKFTNNKKWFFTLIGIDQIWFYENSSQLFGMLQNQGDAEFKKYYKFYEGEKRAYPALANDGGNFIYLSGGALTDTV